MKGVVVSGNLVGFLQAGSQLQLSEKIHTMDMNFLETFEFLKLFDHENVFNINYREY